MDDYISIVAASDTFERFRATLLGNSVVESVGVLFATQCNHPDGSVRLLVHSEEVAPPEAYRERTAISAVLQPAFVALVAKRASLDNSTLVFVHTHPHNHEAFFSATDAAGEGVLLPFLSRRLGGRRVASIVLAGEAVAAREFGATAASARLILVGREVHQLFPAEEGILEPLRAAHFDRQVRAFGASAQRRLAGLHVGIVGLGGTGSLVCEYLAHLGVGRFTLIDPDIIEVTNLNRVANADAEKVGRLKVDVAAEHARRISPAVICRTVPAGVHFETAARMLAEADFIFLCTDSHGSRAVVNQIAYQYLVPCVDIGIGISAEAGLVRSISGRVQYLSPGMGCLQCARVLDPEQVRCDLMTDFERQADPYIRGAHEPQPAVMSLNATISSLGVTMFLSAVAGIPSDARLQNYDGVRGLVRAAVAPPDPDCFVCGPYGVVGRGDTIPLPVRREP